MANGNVWLGGIAIVALAGGIAVAWVGCHGTGESQRQADHPPANPGNPAPPATSEDSRVDVVFAGGHETEGRDGGRPVALVAGALKVPPEVFREAFSHVRPAPAGSEPEPQQVMQNKQALMSALGPYGVTNDRLDTVSNYYRYVRSRGEMWPTTPAKAYATVRKGSVTGFTVTDGGSGFSSPPVVTIPGMPNVKVTATLSFDPDFKKNGAVKELTVAGAANAGAR